MLKKILSYFEKNNGYQPVERIMDPNFFIDEEVKDSYCKNGYVVLQNKVPEQAIKIIKETFEKLRDLPGFFNGKNFIPSPQYGMEIQHYVHHHLNKVNDLVLPNIFDLNKCLYNFFNLLVIKFNKEHTTLIPHQDIAILNEQEATSSFIWVPATQIDDTNGALLVLPGSHKWATWQRTHNNEESPLRKNRKLLLKYMIPLYLNPGDLVIFDSALIHASAANYSGETRIAMNTSVVSKGYNMIHYNINSKTEKGLIEKYIIDEDFWLNLNYMDPENVPEKYQPPILEKLMYRDCLNEDTLLQMIRQHGRL